MAYKITHRFLDMGITSQPSATGLFKSPTRFITAITLIKMMVLLALSDVYLYYQWQQKPINLIRFKPDDFITVVAGNKSFPVDLKKLLLVEGQREYVKLHFDEGKSEMILYALKKLAEELPDQFLRVHKSFIVNMTKAERLNANELKVAGQAIPIGKTYRETLDDYFNLKAQIRLS
jgi:DNA-binding LytR/AlgR family response regulator